MTIAIGNVFFFQPCWDASLSIIAVEEILLLGKDWEGAEQENGEKGEVLHGEGLIGLGVKIGVGNIETEGIFWGC